ncbi:MAG: type II secretion system GspH family protein, partial [Verrucomicrobia bacterium]|nr:type II secretion system GspH family protein [Verrucomicrobiota bacterium]
MKLTGNLLSECPAAGRVAPCAPFAVEKGAARSGLPRPTCRQESAFTMVEIAISLAIIGFALVAIIGVLPIGMDAQKNNRQETIINQDAAYWMEAIRNGAQGLDDLTNYVEEIVITSNNYVTGASGQIRYTQTQPLGYEITNGFRIIGLLSTPKYVYNDQLLIQSNYVFAYVRALSGAASEKAPQTNSSIKDLAFRYRLVPEVIPYSGWDNESAPSLHSLHNPAVLAHQEAYLRKVVDTLYDLDNVLYE